MDYKIRHNRQRLTKEQREEVFQKTGGHCHICGVELTTDKWPADHIVAHIKGGKHDLTNYLPACWTCNRLRWFFHKPEDIQEILRLGRYARSEIREGSSLGKSLDQLYKKILHKNNQKKTLRQKNKHK